MGRLDGKIVLIIGGGADGPPREGETVAIGNGRATAIQCAREGAAVMAADLKLELAQETVAAIRAEGGRAAAVACDASREEDCRAAVEAAVREFGALHLLVNNVGIGIGGNLLKTSTEAFDKMYAVNLRSHFLTMRYAAPEIAKAGGGAIVNVSSMAALRSNLSSHTKPPRRRFWAVAIGRDDAGARQDSRQHDPAGADQLDHGPARDRRSRGRGCTANPDAPARHALGNREGYRVPALRRRVVYHRNRIDCGRRPVRTLSAYLCPHLAGPQLGSGCQKKRPRADSRA